MDTKSDTHISLEAIPADRRLVDELAAHMLISAEARAYALDLLYPPRTWARWVAKLLTSTGTALVLAGVVYFFAFNWTKISPAIKLISIQAAILACLAGSFSYGMQARLSGKVLLLSAALLVGVFLAVFGQIYQTGADAYQLFMSWAVLILPWVLISEFAALWAVWLVVVNTFLILWWQQAAQPDAEMEFMIFNYLAALNGSFLALREYLSAHGASWLRAPWTRTTLTVPILICVLCPSIALIIEPSEATVSILIGALLSAAVHASLYVVYRFKLKDMWCLAASVLSLCILVEVFMIKVMSELFPADFSLMYLFMGAATIGLFTLAIVRLRAIASEFGERDV